VSERNMVAKICANDFMCSMALKMGLIPTEYAIRDSPYPHKPYADSFEVYVYDKYKAEGLDAVRRWFIETILPEFKLYMKK